MEDSLTVPEILKEDKQISHNILDIKKDSKSKELIISIAQIK